MYKLNNIINRFSRQIQLHFLSASTCASYSLLIFSLFISASCYAQKTSILIVTSSSKEFSNKIITSLSTKLEQKNIDTKIQRIDQHNILSRTEAQKYRLIIALGSMASKHILEQNISTPILSILVPTQSLESLKILKKNQSPWSVIFLDQPLQRQIIFSQHLLGPDKILGFLLGPDTSKQLSKITDTAKAMSINIAIEHIDNDAALIPSIKTLINNSDIILSLPDPVTFNPKTIRGILLLSYRNNIPVIGFSKSYVKSGALGAIYSTPEQISLHTSEIIVYFIKNRDFKQTLNYPRYYSIATNQQVARTLGITVKSNNELHELINKSERTE